MASRRRHHVVEVFARGCPFHPRSASFFGHRGLHQVGPHLLPPELRQITVSLGVCLLKEKLINSPPVRCMQAMKRSHSSPPIQVMFHPLLTSIVQGPTGASKMTMSPVMSSLKSNLTLQGTICVRKTKNTHTMHQWKYQQNQKNNLLEGSYNLLPLQEQNTTGSRCRTTCQLQGWLRYTTQNILKTKYIIGFQTSEPTQSNMCIILH